MPEIDQELINFFPGNYNGERDVSEFTKLTNTLVIRLFENTLKYIKPINHLLKNKIIVINIDLTGFECSVVKYTAMKYKLSNNEYTFIVGPKLIRNLLAYNKNKEILEETMKEVFLMFDNLKIKKQFSDISSKNINDIFRNYIYMLRSNGISNLMSLAKKKNLKNNFNQLNQNIYKEIIRLHRIEWETEKDLEYLNFKILDDDLFINNSSLLLLQVLLCDKEVKNNRDMKIIYKKIESGLKIKQNEILLILQYAIKLDKRTFYNKLMRINKYFAHLQSRIDLNISN